MNIDLAIINAGRIEAAEVPDRRCGPGVYEATGLRIGRGGPIAVATMPNMGLTGNTGLS
jgi:hypothetical protein